MLQAILIFNLMDLETLIIFKKKYAPQNTLKIYIYIYAPQNTVKYLPGRDPTSKHLSYFNIVHLACAAYTKATYKT